MQYLGYIRTNYLELFSKLVGQNQYNRRARALRLLVEQLRRYWLVQKGWHLQNRYHLEAKLVLVLSYKRDKRYSNFAGKAAYGQCVRGNLKYFGYNLVAIRTLHGIPFVYDLAPANTDKQAAIETDYFYFCDIFAYKGFWGLKWQTRIFDQTNNFFWTLLCSNQKSQNSLDLDRWLKKVRERIEGGTQEFQHMGRIFERLLTKPDLGLITKVTMKITAHLFRHLLCTVFSVFVQTFEVSAAS